MSVSMIGRVLLGGVLLAALTSIGCPPAATSTKSDSGPTTNVSTVPTNKTPHIPSGPND
jgi:hypothetical protein